MATSPNLILQAINAFVSFLLHSKPHAFVSMVTAAMLIAYLPQPTVEQG
jgi:hypothetical protein